jgi:hypothetical protein
MVISPVTDGSSASNSTTCTTLVSGTSSTKCPWKESVCEVVLPVPDGWS